MDAKESKKNKVPKRHRKHASKDTKDTRKFQSEGDSCPPSERPPMFPEIKKLTDKSFIFEPSLRFVDSDYKNMKEIYIIFYSDKCSACHEIENNWDKTSQEKYPDLKLGKIDVNDPKCRKITTSLSVSAIPLIKAINWPMGDYGLFN